MMANTERVTVCVRPATAVFCRVSGFIEKAGAVQVLQAGNMTTGNISLMTSSNYSPVTKITLGAVNANMGSQMHGTGNILIGSSFTHTPTMVAQGHTQDANKWTPGDGLCSGDSSASKRLNKANKNGKGLRHFSMKVCEKVQKKGATSYNAVADELVAEFTHSTTVMATYSVYDQKNIRRRVYDALNVLMAMNIISKEKKEIRWIGLPNNSAQECQNLEVEKQKSLKRIRQKRTQLEELILQQISFKNLVQRNKASEASSLAPPPSSSVIHLPFIILNTDVRTVTDCSISSDKYHMGMSLGLESGKCSADNLILAKSLIPRSLETYVIGDLDFASLNGRRSYSHSSTAHSESQGQMPSSFDEEEEDNDDDDNEPSSP
ncbi:unnamed protein product, partial [Coregonus sp. 'balchen']